MIDMGTAASNVQFLIITGVSGSGKSYVHNCLEDLGYYCVDNLPVGLVSRLFELISETGGEITRVAVVLDVRDPRFSSDFMESYQRLQRRYTVKLLFLDASDEVLARRFSETRRPHPLAGSGPLDEALALEREQLAPIEEAADLSIDTSRFNVHELREFIRDTFGAEQVGSKLVISVLSFGFKYGIPYNSDLLFDVRFLANPYFVAELKHLSGQDQEVVRFVIDQPDAREFLERTSELLAFLIPRYIKEGKSYLTIAVGCTGGKHRSVVVANRLADSLRQQQQNVSVTHRDLARP